MTIHRSHFVDIKKGRELEAKATKGNWRNACRITQADTGEEVIIETDQVGHKFGGVVVGLIWYDGLHTACREDDAEFISWARNNVSALLDKVEEQEKALKAIKDSKCTPGSEGGCAGASAAAYIDVVEQRDVLQKKVEQLELDLASANDRLKAIDVWELSHGHSHLVCPNCITAENDKDE